LDQEAQAKEQQAAIGANKKRKLLSQNAVKDNERVVVVDEPSEPETFNTARASRSSKGRS
jgi:hypothetical protein